MLLLTLLAFFSFSTTLAQDPVHSTVAQKISWKSRKSFDVDIYFQQDNKKNIQLFVTTTEQNTRFLMEPSDQIIFLNAAGERKIFSFYHDNKRSSAGTKAVYLNDVKLDLDDINWFSDAEITQVRYVNMAEMLTHNYNLSADEKTKFKQVATGFKNQIGNPLNTTKGGNPPTPTANVPTKNTALDAICSKYIKDKKNATLNTYPLVLVKKGNFNCKITFESSQGNNTALLQITEQFTTVIMEKGDKLAFLSLKGEKRYCDFLYTSKKGAENTHTDHITFENTIQLKLEDLAWLSTNDVGEIRFMDMDKKKMMTYALVAGGTAELKQMSTCILGSLDPTNASMESLKTSKPQQINDSNWEKIIPNPSTTVTNSTTATPDAAPHLSGKIWTVEDLLLNPDDAAKKYISILENELKSITNQSIKEIILNYKIGQIFFEQKQYATATTYLKKSLKGILDTNSEMDKKPKIESMLAAIYLNQKNYDGAARDNSNALSTWKNGTSNNEDLNYAFEAYLNQGKILKNLDAADANLNWYAQGVTEVQKNWENELKKRSLSPIVHRSNPEKSTDFNLALLSFKNAEDLLPKFDKNLLTIKQIEAQLEIGDLYFEAGDYNNAKKQYSAAFVNIKRSYAMEHPLYISTTRKLAEIAMAQQSYDEALAYLKQTELAVLKGNTTISDALVNNLDNFNHPLEIVHAITTKGTITYQKNKKNPSESELQKTLAEYDIASKLLLKMRLSHKNEGSNERLENATDKLSQQAVLICHQLHEKNNPSTSSGPKDYKYLEQAFYYAELTKSGVVYELTQDLQSIFEVPKDLVFKENGLKSQINYLTDELRLEYQKGTAQDKNRIQELSQSITNLRKEHQKLLQEIEKKHPAYYALKFSDKNTKVKDLQATLKPNEVFLQYVAADSFIYVLAISNQAMKSQVKMLSEPLFYTVKKLQIALKKNKAENYEDKGLTLYNNAIGDLKSFIQGKKLIISPDAELYYIPFEVLPTQKSNTQGHDEKIYANVHFFVNDYPICYTHSAHTYLWSKQKQKSNSNNQIATWAPNFDAMGDILRQKGIGEGLEPLPGAKKEAEQIASALGGTTYIAEKASETQFKQLAGQYSILHIATHGLLSDSDPLSSSLVLKNEGTEDGLLTAAELYNMSLNADLAVLSACNSGMGKLSKAEGVVGVASGFSYAGVPNIVMSKWPVSDWSTEVLMKEFYKNLQAGMPKDEALQQAKIKYLTDNQDKEKLLAPFFWGGFVLNGNNEPIDGLSGGGWSFWWYFGIVMVIFGIGFWVWRRKKN